MKGKFLGAGAILAIQMVLSCNAVAAETFQKKGNNGTVSCDIFCGAAKDDGKAVFGDRVGYCVEAKNESTREKISCDSVPGLIKDGLTCTCASDIEVRHGNNGTVSCENFCNRTEEDCVSSWNNVTNENIEAYCTNTPGLLKDGKELTCTCKDSYRSLFSDELLIDYTSRFEKVWDDAGSGAKRNVGFFKPIPPPGYHILGHYAHASHGTPNDVVMVLKEKGNNDSLAAPEDYDRIWTDAGSGADRNVAVWSPRCPSRYVAFGLVTTGGNKPSTDEIRCVKRVLTQQANIGPEIWSDAGSGADQDFRAYRIGQATSSPSDGELYISSGSGLFIEGNSERPRLLKIKLPKVDGDPLPIPQLAGHGTPDKYPHTSTTTIYLPFTMVRDDSWSLPKRLKESPIYKLEREDRYSLVDFVNNGGSGVMGLKRESSTTIEESTTLTKEMQIAVEVGAEGGGFSAKVSLSYLLGRSDSSTKSRGEMEGKEIPVQPGKALALYERFSKYSLIRNDGSVIETKKTAQSELQTAEFPKSLN